MFALFRGFAYATIFIGGLLVLLPARLLQWTGVTSPEATGPAQIAGIVVVLGGIALAVWCVLTFGLAGRGTPAPFDPPRRLVTTGPYRLVRNPMYVGAVTALAGAALFYGSATLLAYAILFAAAAHAFVRLYEEPRLGRVFGREYDAYRERVGRWWPIRPDE